MKNIITKMKTSTDGLNSTVKRKEEGISEPEDSTMKLKINWKKKINRASRTYGTLTKILMFISLKFWNERRKKWGKKAFKEIMVENFPKFGKRQKCTYSRN